MLSASSRIFSSQTLTKRFCNRPPDTFVMQTIFWYYAKPPRNARAFAIWLKSRRRSLCLELHPDKTHTCVTAAQGVDFLGFRVGTMGVRIRGSNKAKFKQRILRILETQKPRKTPDASLRSLIYRINSKSVDRIKSTWTF